MIQFDSFMQAEGVPIYQQIIRYVKQGIAAGTIRDGEELPSRRVLSALLAVNPNTVQKAFKQLEDEGLVTSRAGAKSCIQVTPEQIAALRRALLDPLDHRPWLDVASAREGQGALAGALEALARASALDGGAALAARAQRERVRLRLN